MIKIIVGIISSNSLTIVLGLIVIDCSILFSLREVNGFCDFFSVLIGKTSVFLIEIKDFVSGL